MLGGHQGQQSCADRAIRPLRSAIGPAALHSQPIERARLREFIRAQFCDGSYPQLVLRFGTVIQTAVSIRRSPASVLFADGGEHLGINCG